MSEKIFRDPLYNYVCIDRQHDRWLLELLDTPEMQRLRRIHQLGVSSYTYPGASHNRLAHSLGVVHVMGVALEQLMTTDSKSKVQSARQALLGAALLHDVGHGPFSHLAEACLGTKHEKWSIRIVLDPESSVHRVLSAEDRKLPRDIADLIEEENVTPSAWQKSLLSSQLDADRVDYLRRDSLCTGAGYGHFDWFRLMSTVQIVENGPHKGDLAWPEKSATAIEEFVFSRYYMYQNVYLHKTTRGFEKLLEAMWRRGRQHFDNGDRSLIEPSIADFWDTAPAEQTVVQYLALEEHTVLSQIQAWTAHADPALADLARRFLHRDGFAVVDPPPSSDRLALDYTEWEDALHAVLRRNGVDDPTMYALADTLKAKYQNPYVPERTEDVQSARNAIRILKDGHPVEVTEVLPRLKAVTQAPADPDRRRYYVPKEHRDAVWKLARSMTTVT